jgi:hypothetical protein
MAEPLPLPADLVELMGKLYGEEINCSVSSFWDAGWTVRLGDGMTLLLGARTFSLAGYSFQIASKSNLKEVQVELPFPGPLSDNFEFA